MPTRCRTPAWRKNDVRKVMPPSRIACVGINPKRDTISWSCVKPNVLATIIRRQSIHVTQGVRSRGAAFDRDSPKCRNLLPLLTRRGTIGIAAARLLGEFLHLEHGNGFTRCLRHFGRRGWQWSRHESFDFVRVEPDEVAQSTYIHVHSRVFRKALRRSSGACRMGSEVRPFLRR